jgi:hypothetical protein
MTDQHQRGASEIGEETCISRESMRWSLKSLLILRGGRANCKKMRGEGGSQFENSCFELALYDCAESYLRSRFRYSIRAFDSPPTPPDTAARIHPSSADELRYSHSCGQL